MVAGARSELDWQRWLDRWDVQQAGYLPQREARFQAMLDVLETLLSESFVALDLASGPGSLSQRLLERFPGARAIAVDTDPVLLALGEGALGSMDGRLRWVKADLTQPEWLQALGEPQVDAVLSTTALHWLSGDVLVRVYHHLGQLVRPGGVVLNGDHLAFPASMERFRTYVARRKEQQRSHAFEQAGVEDWESWWAALRREPGLEALFAEREARLALENRAI